MRIKTGYLTGAQLDWAVAQCEGDEPCKLGDEIEVPDELKEEIKNA